MVQFQILSGKQTGTRWVARRFPVQLGREAGCDLRLEEPGVWERHCKLSLDPAQGFIVTAQPDALLTVNQQPVQSAQLRNGDSLALGSVRLQFWLGEARQRGLGLREAAVWALILVLCLIQVGLVYWLSK